MIVMTVNNGYVGIHDDDGRSSDGGGGDIDCSDVDLKNLPDVVAI